MTNSTNETKQYGFLPHRLGKVIIYCNRTNKSLWYKREGDDNVNIDAPSFRSLNGGLLGLTFYKVTRGGTESWKVGLLLLGPQDQVYHFESGCESVFCRGLLWGLCSASEDQLKGEIGINPTPADPSSTDSAFAKSILYCNLFANGVELPRFPGGTEHDWRELATIAFEKCNRRAPEAEEIPETSDFMDAEKAEKYNKTYQPRNAGKAAPPARPTVPNTRSGVTYPNQPLKAQTAPAATQTMQDREAREILERETTRINEELATLGAAYNGLLDYVDQNYKLNSIEIDQVRMGKLLERGGVTKFEDLSVYRKHQAICGVSKILILEKAALPNPQEHPAIARIDELFTATPLTLEVFHDLRELLEQAFSEIIPF